jgi:glycosyltransferase involved in cell wall biosynthesis
VDSASAEPADGAVALPPGSISACIIVRNEEPVIERCLRSLNGAVDEVIVVHDGPCEDRTVEIAQALGARTFVRQQTGNPEYHRVFAYERARGEWLLNIDADEFLSEELRARLPSLAERKDVNGFEFLWRIWDGTRYVTASGPYKRVLQRRSAVHMLGLLQFQNKLDGRVERTSLQLEHRPRYNNYTFKTVMTKWRRWARIQARQFLSDFDQVPKFNYPDMTDWPAYRKVANALSPLLIVPYGLATFALAVRSERNALPLSQNVRIATFMGIYNAMVQFYVARYLYVPRSRP